MAPTSDSDQNVSPMAPAAVQDLPQWVYKYAFIANNQLIGGEKNVAIASAQPVSIADE